MYNLPFISLQHVASLKKHQLLSRCLRFLSDHQNKTAVLKIITPNSALCLLGKTTLFYFEKGKKKSRMLTLDGGHSSMGRTSCTSGFCHFLYPIICISCWAICLKHTSSQNWGQNCTKYDMHSYKKKYAIKLDTHSGAVHFSIPLCRWKFSGGTLKFSL